MSSTPPISTSDQTLDAETAAALSDETRAAALVVTQFRTALDWMLTHPDWEGAIALAISKLGYKGQRQGISFRQAALSLPLEQKCDAIRHILKGDFIERPSRSDAKMLTRLWAETSLKTNAGRVRLSSKEWNLLCGRLALRISTKYSEYKRAQNLLYVSYAYLADQTARISCKDHSRRGDAVQEGRIALLQAIDKIDTDKAFEAYARQWVKRRIHNFIMRERIPVKAPINLISESLREISSEYKTSERSKTLVMNCLRDGIVWLDSESVSEIETGEALRENPENTPNRQAEQRDDQLALANAIEELTQKQREVLTMRFGLEDESGTASLAEVAAVTGISRQQVFQREKRAMAKLKDNLHGLQKERSSAG